MFYLIIVKKKYYVTITIGWHDSSLVLVQPRKTHPYITESLLMGRKESNQRKKTGHRALIFGMEHNLFDLYLFLF